MINLTELNIKKTHELLQNGELSARELTALYLENIKERDKNPSDNKAGINAYLEVFEDAFDKAEQVDKKIKSGQKIGLLTGIPFAVKDNILIKNKKCSAGSKILEGFVAPYSATAIEKLEKEGAVFLGRTNMDEFGMGSSTENSAFFTTKNPYDNERVPGGSSGGSAAAVAGQECLAALGSDTGGSVRQPASFCGVVGLKPTYGAVSRNGLIALSSSLDQIGPLTKTAEDAEIIFNVIKGKDILDSTTVESRKIQDSRRRQGFGGQAKFKIQDIKIGIPKEFFSLEGENNGIDEEVVLSIKKAIDVFKDLGFKIKEVSLPSLEYAIEIYYIIMPAEASSNLARYDGVKYGFFKKGESIIDDYIRTRQYGFGDEPRRRILLGAYALSSGYYDEYYGWAQKVRNLMKEDFRNIFNPSTGSGVDVLLNPTVPTPAFKIGERTKDPIKMYLGDIFTCAANLAGAPAISIPCSQSAGGLPIGFQFIAPWFEEEKLFYLGKMYETLS